MILAITQECTRANNTIGTGTNESDYYSSSVRNAIKCSRYTAVIVCSKRASQISTQEFA